VGEGCRWGISSLAASQLALFYFDPLFGSLAVRCRNCRTCLDLLLLLVKLLQLLLLYVLCKDPAVEDGRRRETTPFELKVKALDSIENFKVIF